MCYVHSTILSQAYWKPIEIYCWNSLHQGRSVPRCWYMKLLLPLLKVKYDTRWHKLTILSIHTFNKFNSSPILRKSWGWHRISWTIFRPLFISLPLKRWEKHSFYFFDKKWNHIMLEYRISIKKTKFRKPDGRKGTYFLVWTGWKVIFKFTGQYQIMAASY